MREYIIGNIQEAERAASAIEEFLLGGQDPAVFDDLPLDHLPAADARSATEFASALVACLIRMRYHDAPQA